MRKDKPIKKQWKKPEIKALVRGESEEAVLFACKGTEVGTGGPNGSWACTAPGQGNSSSHCWTAATS